MTKADGTELGKIAADPICQRTREGGERAVPPVLSSLPPDSSAEPPSGLDEGSTRLIRELQTYRIELEMQNDDLRRTQEALILSRDRFFHLFHRSPLGYLVLDEAGMIRDANETFLRMVGGDGVEASGRPFAEFLVETDRRVFLGRYRAFFRNPSGIALELEMKTSDGSRLFVRLRGAALDPSPSEPLEKRRSRLLVTVSDATEQKRLEDLRTAELLLTQSIERADNIQEILRICTESAVSISGMDMGAFYVLNWENGALELAFQAGLPRELIFECDRFEAKNPLTLLVMNGFPVYGRYDAAPVSPCEPALREGFLGFGLIPIRHDNRVIGCLNLASRTKEEVPMLYRPALEKIAGRMGQIIARQKAETALRDSEERFRRIFESAAVGISRVTPDGRFIQVNGRFQRLLGYSEAELVGKNFRDVTHPEDLAENERLFSRILRGEQEECSLEKRYLRRDGGVVWGVLHFSLVRDAKGEPLYGVAVVEDVTERKRAEEERERLAQAIEHAGEVVVITAPDGTIQYVNPAFERVTGYTREEVIGRNPRILQSGMHDERFYRDLWRTLREGDTWTGRFTNRRKDGAIYTETATITPVFGPSGAVVSYVAVKRDITREIQLEDQLRQAQKMEAVGRLAGGVAHDFNNLLSVILGYGEMLLEEIGEGQLYWRRIKAIHEAGLRAQSLTRQLLSFSRKQVLEMKVVDLNAVIAGFEKMLRRLIGEDVTLELRLMDGEIRVKADIGQMEQVLMNLAVNARDAMPDGGTLSIETATLEVDDAHAAAKPGLLPGPHALIRVTDTGHGMDWETRSRLFEPFFTTKGENGTGLGLSTVHGIVHQHAGHIGFHSEPNRGTAFKIYLPLAREDLSVIPGPVCRREPSAGKALILLVEDDVSVRGMARRILETAGYHLLIAETAQAAVTLAHAHEGPIHLVLTDVIMPGMKGPEVFQRISESHPEAGVIYMSGYTSNVISRQGVLDEGVHFIQKPLTVHSLLEKVAVALRGDSGTA